MSIRINKDKIRIFAVSIAVPLLLGAAVGLLTSGGDSYKTLHQPAFAPPAILFPIAWSVLYVMMGTAHGIILSNRLQTTRTQALYYTQLIVNLLWSFIFFSLELRLFAFIWIILLDILVILTAVSFCRKNKAAGLLLLPYLLWVLFAAYLNLGVYLLNR